MSWFAPCVHHNHKQPTLQLSLSVVRSFIISSLRIFQIKAGRFFFIELKICPHSGAVPREKKQLKTKNIGRVGRAGGSFYKIHVERYELMSS